MAASYEHLLAGVELLGSGYGFSAADNDAGVVGYGYGWIRRDDVWTTDLGLVLLVEKGQAGFPYSHVRVKGVHGPADVPCCAFLLERAPIADAPARAIPDQPAPVVGGPLGSVAGWAVGTAALALAGGRYLVTAGHVLAGPDVYCGQRVVGNRLEIAADNPYFDVAFVELDEALRGPQVQLRPDGREAPPVAAFTWSDLHDRASVYRPTRGETALPFILGAGMTLHLVEREGKVQTQTGMIMTEACTQGGDSGTGLVSAAGGTLGVLSHGRREFSFFTALADAQRAGIWPKEES
jgi:hypothetical protein